MKLKTLFVMCAVLLSAYASAQDFEVDKFTTANGENMEIMFIKHASLVITYDGHVIYIDPVSDFADFSKLPKADVILF